MPFSPSLPLINGNRFDFSSVGIKLNGKRYTGIQAIDYAPECIPGMVYGQTTAYPIGRTRGQLKMETANLEILREDFGDLSQDLLVIAQGLFEANFIITVSIAEPLSPSSGPAQVDTILGARFSRFNLSAKQGPDPLAVKLDFTFMNMLVNGLPLLSLLSPPPF